MANRINKVQVHAPINNLRRFTVKHKARKKAYTKSNRSMRNRIRRVQCSWRCGVDFGMEKPQIIITKYNDGIDTNFSLGDLLNIKNK